MENYTNLRELLRQFLKFQPYDCAKLNELLPFFFLFQCYDVGFGTLSTKPSLEI